MFLTKRSFLSMPRLLMIMLLSAHAFCALPVVLPTQVEPGRYEERRIDLSACSLPSEYITASTHETEPQGISSRYQIDQFGYLWGAIVMKRRGLLSRSEEGGEVFVVRVNLITSSCVAAWHRPTNLESNVALLLTPSGCVLLLSNNVLTRVSRNGVITGSLMLPMPNISEGIAYRILQSPDRRKLLMLTTRGQSAHWVVVNAEMLNILKECSQVVHNWNEPTLTRACYELRGVIIRKYFRISIHSETFNHSEAA